MIQQNNPQAWGNIYFKTFILLAFASVAVFGFLAMGGHSGPMHSCIASLGGQAPCPENDPVGYASFHLGFFKVLSSVIDGGIAFLLLVFSAILALLGVSLFSGVSTRPTFYFDGYRTGNTEPDTYHRSLQSWLAFHENSPSFIAGSMA